MFSYIGNTSQLKALIRACTSTACLHGQDLCRAKWTPPVSGRLRPVSCKARSAGKEASPFWTTLMWRTFWRDLRRQSASCWDCQVGWGLGKTQMRFPAQLKYPLGCFSSLFIRLQFIQEGWRVFVSNAYVLEIVCSFLGRRSLSAKILSFAQF